MLADIPTNYQQEMNAIIYFSPSLHYEDIHAKSIYKITSSYAWSMRPTLRRRRSDEIRCSEFGKHHEVVFMENTVLNNEESFSISDLAFSVSGSVNNTLNKDSFNIDIEYLLGATDDKFGILPSPRFDLVYFAEQKNGDMASVQEQSSIVSNGYRSGAKRQKWSKGIPRCRDMLSEVNGALKRVEPTQRLAWATQLETYSHWHGSLSCNILLLEFHGLLVECILISI
eukprot:Gb_20403 [translate_table: standard]